jgi:hypothetical protein
MAGFYAKPASAASAGSPRNSGGTLGPSNLRRVRFIVVSFLVEPAADLATFRPHVAMKRNARSVRSRSVLVATRDDIQQIQGLLVDSARP